MPRSSLYDVMWLDMKFKNLIWLVYYISDGGANIKIMAEILIWEKKA